MAGYYYQYYYVSIDIAQMYGIKYDGKAQMSLMIFYVFTIKFIVEINKTDIFPLLEIYRMLVNWTALLICTLL